MVVCFVQLLESSMCNIARDKAGHYGIEEEDEK